MTDKKNTAPQDGTARWVTSADVAHHAGVSRASVSRVFTPGAHVSPKTREKVMASAHELGYRPNILARSMIQRQSNLVGIIVSGFGSPFLPHLMGPLVDALKQQGLAPLIMDSKSAEHMEDTLRYLLSYRVAGAILTSGTPPIELAREYARLQVPVVLINRDVDIDGVDTVCSDNRKGGALAARCLLDAGARRLAYVNRPSITYSGKERSVGFCEEIAQIGHSGVQFELIEADRVDYSGGRSAARQLFDRPATQRPDGVFCATDDLCMGFLDAMRHDFGLECPSDVRVVGFDDIPMAAADAYSLTTVQQDPHALATTAVSLLAERMAAPDLEKRGRLIDVSLVTRRSSEC